jgi:putative ABC transport system permease protein
MIRNYFKVAFRNIIRNKTFSFINIIGLSIGISAALVIFLIVNYDLTFDKFEKDNARIYRVVSEFSFQGDISHSEGVALPLTNAVYSELSGVETASHFQVWNDDKRVTIQDIKTGNPVTIKKEKKAVFADENYFRLISYEWLAGSPSVSLKVPYQLVLTKSKADFYFPGVPTAEIIGREIVFEDTIHTIVSGIVGDLKENTDFTFTTFISRATLEKTSLRSTDWEEWNNTNSITQLFIRLHPGTDPGRVTADINALYKKYERHSPEDHTRTSFLLQPLADIHFNSEFGNFDQRLAHKPTLYGLAAIAIFLLLLGCINFINLTTAQSSQRAKEIGIRKTIGSSKRQLVLQFLSETFFITCIATLFSLVIAPLLLKIFSDFIPEGLHYNPGDLRVILLLLLLTIVISLLSGFYPALLLSSYKPAAVLKNQTVKDSSGGSKVYLRKILSVSQFVIAQVFIFATILVSQQIKYSINKDLGYRRDAVIYFSAAFRDSVKTNRSLLLNKLKSIPEVEMVSMGYSNPTSKGMWTSTMKFNNGKQQIESSVQVTLGDTNYIKLYNLKLLAGGNLPYSDTINTVLINETYLHILGFQNPQDVLGKMINWNQIQTSVAGVLADFHQKSLHEPIGPLVIANSSSSLKTFNVLLRNDSPEGKSLQSAIRKIKQSWQEVYPAHELEINFIDESVAKYYEAEKHISKLLIWAAGLSIFISCLGLLGLIIYITNQRTKEIGIRKVVGASVAQIISLLSKDFVRLIIIAFIIAAPIAWYSANKWLENFAYRTSVSWWIFLAGGSLMLIIALVILILKTYRVAAANPIYSLRNE